MIRVTGTYQGKAVALTVENGEFTEGKYEPAAAAALGAVRANVDVDVPGLWSGPASLDDPWALRALFGQLLERPSFEGDDPPPLEHGPPGAVY